MAGYVFIKFIHRKNLLKKLTSKHMVKLKMERETREKYASVIRMYVASQYGIDKPGEHTQKMLKSI